MGKDQRGLPTLKGVPPDLLPDFRDLNDAVMHWMGRVQVVRVEEGRKKVDEQVLIICPESLYSCGMDTRILRSFKIGAIREVVINNDDDVLIAVPEIDYFFRPLGGRRNRNIIVKILKRLYYSITNGRDLKIMNGNLEEGSIHLNNLSPPPGWKFHIEPVPTRESMRSKRHNRDLDYQGTEVYDDRERIRYLEDQLSTCKEALRQAIGDQSVEIDNIREQFLEYDKEVVAYLNKVYAAFPNVKSALGTPPSMGMLSGLEGHNSTSARLQEENNRLRSRILELEANMHHSTGNHSPGGSPQQTQPKYHWHVQSPTSPTRIPAAEARRRHRPPVSGNMGPAGPHRTFTQYASSPTSSFDFTRLDF
eukprot:TRINITY_DN838_c3_g1_i1.p1 TRINITY_DN838_c3_g1~~TRINITY_DN838_c3_g1_i1.p1  ORF type:complete len:387 (+),score=109.77 TRINITY_DN838_c3_g1_i1:74-1162(+)